MKSLKVSVLLLPMLWVFSCAQILDARYEIRLKTRIFIPTPGVEDGLDEYFKRNEKNDRIHAIAQFDNAPTLKEREELLAKDKLVILDLIPEKAFFVSLPNNFEHLERLIERMGIRWVGEIKADYKISPGLLKDIPNYAKRDSNRVAVIVYFFGDVPIKLQSQFLSSKGADSVNRIHPLNAWSIVHDQNALRALADNDIVKFIIEIPPPPERDNDGSRSLTGTSSDISSTTYGLSGAGVVIGHWEDTHASTQHLDLTGKITIADPPISQLERSGMHDESISVNNQFDNGEQIYVDMDESRTVSPGDSRLSGTGVVAAGDADVGTGLVYFPFTTRFNNQDGNQIYNGGEAIYQDNDNSFTVTAGDRRLTPVGAYAVGTTVSSGPPADSDIGTNLMSFFSDPHYHSTHVAGTVLGTGSQSLLRGGSVNQWRGIAAGSTIRSYNAFTSLGSDYLNATTNNVSISTNSWGTSHAHQVVPPNYFYDSWTEFYDGIISGRRSDGNPTGYARTIQIFGSAGNQGRPERFTDNISINGVFDNGESIYIDSNDDGAVTSGEIRLSGALQPLGTVLLNFGLDIMHNEATGQGTYSNTENIYKDLDASKTVTVGDLRITVSSASTFTAGSTVATGNSDINSFLRQFKLWGNVRIPNSAKNTIEVANVASDDKSLDPSSSKGPTPDGRIKPDISGPGSQNSGDNGVTSTYPGNTYYTIGGTSMSTPAVAASSALLEEWYKTSCSTTDPSPALIKALLIHTSEDLTNIPNVGTGYTGPDFAFGFGRIRLKEAIELVPFHLSGTASVIGNTDYTISVGATSSLKITLSWTDVPWSIAAAPSASTGLLVNDLDLLLIAPDGTQFTPWLTNGNNPFATATRNAVLSGTAVAVNLFDHRNTIEQVEIPNAMAGTWTIRVIASSLNIPVQNYVLVGEALNPNSTNCNSNPASDVWIKDNPTDVGTTPSSGSMWVGTDSWNRIAPDGIAVHQNPEFGSPNYLYTNIRNRGMQTIRFATVDAWISTLAVGLVWPAGFVYVGRFNVANLSPGEVKVVGPLEWQPAETGHKCMYFRVASPQDPITFSETTNVWTNAMNSNNIAYHNMTVVDLASSRSIPFLVRNPEKSKSRLDLLIKVPKAFLEVGEVYLAFSPGFEKIRSESDQGLLLPAPHKMQIFQNYEADTVPKGSNIFYDPQTKELRLPIYRINQSEITISDLSLSTYQAEQVIITFSSPQKAKAEYDASAILLVDGKERDGIRFKVRTGYAK